MSLILEALKKLDREKGTPERGFLVLAHLQRPLQGKGRAWVLLVAGLGFAAIAGLGFALWRGQGGGKAPAASGPGPSRPAPPAPIAAPATSAWTTPISPRTAVGPARSAVPFPAKVDPTEATPPLRADTPPADLRLNAISHQDGRPVAILNDRLVREGDAFDGIRVLRIGEAEVEVEVGGVRRVIRF